MCDNILAFPTTQHHNRGSLRCENVEISFKLSEIRTQEIQSSCDFLDWKRLLLSALDSLDFYLSGFSFLSAFFAQRQPQSKRQKAESDGDIILEKKSTSEHF